MNIQYILYNLALKIALLAKKILPSLIYTAAIGKLENHFDLLRDWLYNWEVTLKSEAIPIKSWMKYLILHFQQHGKPRSRQKAATHHQNKTNELTHWCKISVTLWHAEDISFKSIKNNDWRSQVCIQSYPAWGLKNSNFQKRSKLKTVKNSKSKKCLHDTLSQLNYLDI